MVWANPLDMLPAGHRRAGSRVVRFGLVGLAGLLLDMAVLALTLGWAGPYWGRAISFGVVVIATWAVNRRVTFGDRRSRYSLPVELARYFLAMCAGGAVNMTVYVAVLSVLGTHGLLPFAALAAGSLAGMTINLTLAYYSVFRP
jgi:putative flippase GtrA